MPDIVTTWMDGDELVTEYDIEYITDPKKWEIVCSGKHGAPWELYEHIVKKDFSEAMEWLCIAMFRKDIFDVRMMETTYLNGKNVRERSFILSNTFKWSMKFVINDTVLRENEKLSAQHDKDTELIEDGIEFLEKYRIKERFMDFRREKYYSI